MDGKQRNTTTTTTTTTKSNKRTHTTSQLFVVDTICQISEYFRRLICLLACSFVRSLARLLTYSNANK